IVRLRMRILDPTGQAENERCIGGQPRQVVGEVEHDAVFLGVADPAVEPSEAFGRFSIEGARGLGQIVAFQVGGTGSVDRLARGGWMAWREGMGGRLGGGPVGAKRSSGAVDTPGGRSITSSVS